MIHHRDTSLRLFRLHPTQKANVSKCDRNDYTLATRMNERRRLLFGLLFCSLPVASNAFLGRSNNNGRAVRPGAASVGAAAKRSRNGKSEDERRSPGTQDSSMGDSQESPSSKGSRGRAMSAQPAGNEQNPKQKAMSKLAQPLGSTGKKSSANQKGGTRQKNQTRESLLLPRAGGGFQNKKDSGGAQTKNRNKSSGPSQSRRAISDDDSSFLSLLPPPIKSSNSERSAASKKNDSLSDGLSSWEDFLGSGTTPSSDGSSRSASKKSEASSSRIPSSGNEQGSETTSPETAKDNRLPSISDLFPPSFSTSSGGQSNRRSGRDNDDESNRQSTPTLGGVLPVSDLFYRSSQSLSENQDANPDDEELPFSAEQSNRVATGNRIRVRRNQAQNSSKRTSASTQRRKSSVSRKMVRRGMEMLVGGVPINADPPQRYVDLVYAHNEAEHANWHETITMSTRDFGPMLHTPSVGLVSKAEVGLFCEQFVHYTSKWDVCPKDLRTIINSFSSSGNAKEEEEEEEETPVKFMYDNISDDVPINEAEVPAKKRTEYAGQGFGNLKSRIPARDVSSSDHLSSDTRSSSNSNLGGELVFTIGVSREDLQSEDLEKEVPVLERVLAKGIRASTDRSGFTVVITKLILTELDDGTTQIMANFGVQLKDVQSLSYGEIQSISHQISSSLAQATDEGEMQLAMAAAAREEMSWPEELRNRVVEEFLFEDDEDDIPWEEETTAEGAGTGDDDESEENGGENHLDYLRGIRESEADDLANDGPFGIPGSVEYHKDDIFLGGGNDGVFWNYSERNAKSSPYGGTLGLRLVDAVTERAKERQPRVIAVGDVHGCIDELQELLRRCDFRPGDLLVFLGDLVSKGPDSAAVVQMAREIGAIGVRGNHDFEVIRWHQAIKSGVDPPVVGSEHFHIASCLSKADMKWMYR